VSAFIPARRDAFTLVPVAAGLFWLAGGGSTHWLLCALLPGTLLLSSGIARMLWPGARGIVQTMAAGAILGVVLAVPAVFAGGFGPAAIAALLSAASFVVAGRLSLADMRPAPNVPPPEPTWAVCVKAALDEALLGYFVVFAHIPNHSTAEMLCDAAQQLDTELDTLGIRRNPLLLHRVPPAPEDVQIARGRAWGHSFEWLRFSSGFTADARLYGAADWDRAPANRNCHAMLFRHADATPRPWLLCIHGYRMGVPLYDLQLFAPGWLHRHLGLNLVLPQLPLHGRRKIGRMSGDHYLDGNVIHFLHTQSQALWDLRRTIAWIRATDPGAHIGVLGYSLGGYNAALLSAYEEDLDFVIAGIPLSDVPSAIWPQVSQPVRDYFDERGFTKEKFQSLLEPVSPLTRPPLLDNSRLAIFAGTADRVTDPGLAQRLAGHWGVSIAWYQGGHLTFRGEDIIRRTIETTMLRAGWPLSHTMRNAVA
jgi:hypothetical protein